MRDAAEVILLGFIEQGGHDLGIFAEDLDAVDAFFRGEANPFAGEFRGVDGVVRPAFAGEGREISEDARGDNLVLGAAFAFV